VKDNNALVILVSAMAGIPVALILGERLLRRLRKPSWDRRLNPLFAQKLDQILAAEPSYAHREAVVALDMVHDNRRRALYLRLPGSDQALHVSLAPDRSDAEIYWASGRATFVQGPAWYRTTDPQILQRLQRISDLLARLPTLATDA
jgi:hypothetical protein